MHIAIHIDQHITHSSSEKLFLAIDGNPHRDPELDNVQRVGDFGVLSSKWGVFITPLPSSLSLYVQSEVERLRARRGG